MNKKNPTKLENLQHSVMTANSDIIDQSVQVCNVLPIQCRMTRENERSRFGQGITTLPMLLKLLAFIPLKCFV